MNRQLFPSSPVSPIIPLTRQNANDIGENDINLLNNSELPTNEQMGNTSEMDDFVNQMRNDDSQLGNLDDENNMNNNNNNINNNNNEDLTNEQMGNISMGGRSMRKRRRTRHKKRCSHKRRRCSHKRRKCSHKRRRCSHKH
jgi:hypothetical protein